MYMYYASIIPLELKIFNLNCRRHSGVDIKKFKVILHLENLSMKSYCFACEQRNIGV